MNRHQCRECGDPIPNGQAHIRSENFRQVAWCDFCWLVRHVKVSLGLAA